MYICMYLGNLLSHIIVIYEGLLIIKNICLKLFAYFYVYVINALASDLTKENVRLEERKNGKKVSNICILLLKFGLEGLTS